VVKKILFKALNAFSRNPPGASRVAEDLQLPACYRNDKITTQVQNLMVVQKNSKFDI
jgi:hypothetical protein